MHCKRIPHIIICLSLTLLTAVAERSWREDFQSGDSLPQPLNGHHGWSAPNPNPPETPPSFEMTAPGLAYHLGYFSLLPEGARLTVRNSDPADFAQVELPFTVQAGETLYFSFLVRNEGGPQRFAWFAFGPENAMQLAPDLLPSWGIRQLWQKGKPAYTVRIRNGAENQEGAAVQGVEGVNFVVGRIRLGTAHEDPDVMQMVLNPSDWREPAEWDSKAEFHSNADQIRRLWLRKASRNPDTDLSVTSFDRLRTGRSFADVVAPPVRVEPPYTPRTLLSSQRGISDFRLAAGAETGVPELRWHALPPMEGLIESRLERSPDLQAWEPVPSNQTELIGDRDGPEGFGRTRITRIHAETGDTAFFRTAAVLTDAQADSPVVAVVNPEARFQVMDGFGASLAYTAQNISDELADLFFDPDRGLGLSLARIRINFRNTDAEGNVLPNSWERRAALKAQERGAAVWASPWSANGNLKEGNTTGDHDHRGGRLKDDEYGTYAQNLVDFVSWAAAEGIELAAISPQNEPDYRFGNNESMDWTPAELLGFISAHFRPALHAAGFEALPIVAPELMDWHRKGGWEQFYNHPDTDILAFHNYDWAFDFFRNGSDTRFPAPVDTDKRIWMTEISDVFSGEDYTDTIDDALVWAKHIHRVTVEASGSAWHWWWLVPATHGNNNNETLVTSRDGVIEGGGVVGDGLPHMLKRGWMIGQFSRFVRPGYQRISVEPAAAGGLRLAGFEGDGRLVIVAIHPGQNPQPFRLEGLPRGFNRVHAWVTSETDNLAPRGHVPHSGTALDVTLPARAIVTLVFE